MKEKNDEVKPLHFETDVEYLRSIAKENARAGHQWRQRGTQLVCISCLSTHATYIPVGVRLVGIDEEGKPKFE